MRPCRAPSEGGGAPLGDRVLRGSGRVRRLVREGEASGAIDAVVLLLRYGADVNPWDEERTTTPLLTAVKDNHIEAVRLLLAAGADPNVRDEEGETPLRLFTKSGSLEMVRLLLQCGADMRSRWPSASTNTVATRVRPLGHSSV
jgi:ankyrin repeat protein